MNRVFASSYYFFAVLSPKDRAHQKAREFAARHEGGIVTTAWVLTELADGLAVTANRAAVSRLVARLEAETPVSESRRDSATSWGIPGC